MLRIGVLHPLITNKKEPQWTLFYCRWRDLNPQGSLHTPLKRARIPIPPHRHKYYIQFSTINFYILSYHVAESDILYTAHLAYARTRLLHLQKQHLIAFSAESYIDTICIIQFSIPTLNFVDKKYSSTNIFLLQTFIFLLTQSLFCKKIYSVKSRFLG